MNIPKDKTATIAVYTCSCCGYETFDAGNSSRHKKSTKCKQPNVVRTARVMMDVKDVMELLTTISGTNMTQNGDHNTIDQSTNITINLVVPDKSVVQSVYDAVKNPECVAEIRGADPHQIPAILFKYTRGAKSEHPVIRYDTDKNVVKCIDPVTKKEVSKDLKKYRNEYLAENADVYDKDYHIPYMPPKIQPAMRELAESQFDTGKKKDEPIPAAEVIKMCATGDHRMYKLPHESKKFYTQVADNVDKEIKSTT